MAVLPFVDMSPARDEEYFCDGMAEEYLRKPLELDPDCNFAHLNLGHLYLAKGCWDRSQEEYKKARDIPWTAAFIGSVYAKMGQDAKARKILNQQIAQSKE